MQTTDGATPLYIACHNGHQAVAALLLDRCADVNQAGVRWFREGGACGVCGNVGEDDESKTAKRATRASSKNKSARTHKLTNPSVFIGFELKGFHGVTMGAYNQILCKTSGS